MEAKTEIRAAKEKRAVWQNYDFWIPFLMYAALLGFKLLFIVDNRSMPVISDEFRYVRFARALLSKGYYRSTQYPPGYPLAILPAFLFGDRFYGAIKVLNAVYSSFLPVFTYMIARLYLDKRKSAVCGVFAMILPFQYVSTMEIMSENLFFPLFFLAVYVLLRDFKHAVLSDVLLGFLIGLLYLIRHVGLALIPVFALVWFVKQLDGREKLWRIFLRGFLIVAVLLLTYSPWLYMCLRQGLSLKNALGFGIASSSDPAQLTLPRLLNSFSLYICYTVLATAPVLGYTLKALRGLELKRGRLFCAYNRLVLTVYGFSGMLLVAVSRHSWKAFYNYPDFTKMKGRYIMYIPLFCVILAMAASCGKKKIVFRHRWTHILVVYVLPAALLACALSRNIGQYLTAEVEYYESVDGQKAVLVNQCVYVGYLVCIWAGGALAALGDRTRKIARRMPVILLAGTLVYEAYAADTYLAKLSEMNAENEALRCREVRDVMTALELENLPKADTVTHVYVEVIPEFTFMRRNVEMFLSEQVKFHRLDETAEEDIPAAFYLITRSLDHFEAYTIVKEICTFDWEDTTYYFVYVAS